MADTLEYDDMKRVIFLDYLRVIAIFMVLVIHSTEPYYLGGDGTYVATRADGAWVTLFEIICRACVPLFVMASAYLLFPTTKTFGEFLPRRLLKIGLPFLVWCGIYTAAYGGEWGRVLFNFPLATGGHLWFVPMLFGLYLLMPLMSPWAGKASEKELRTVILVWLATTLIPFARALYAALYGNGWGHLFGEANFDNIPFIWGECGWNQFGTFQYVSGFVGYMLMGLYFRKFASTWTIRDLVHKALPAAILGAAIVIAGFGNKIICAHAYPLNASYSWAVELETSIEYCSLGVVALAFAWFSLICNICTGEGFFYQRVIRPLAEASFGIYLIHILLLVPISDALKPLLPTPIAILCIALASFAGSSLIVLFIKRIPLLKRLV